MFKQKARILAFLLILAIGLVGQPVPVLAYDGYNDQNVDYYIDFVGFDNGADPNDPNGYVDITGDFVCANFREAVLWWIRNTSGPHARPDATYIRACDAAAFSSLNVSGRGVTDLSGLEHFTYISTLIASNNQLTGSLDLSGMYRLVTINVSHNQLTSLNVAGLSVLAFLTANDNQLTSLDVRGISQTPSAVLVHRNNIPHSADVQQDPTFTFSVNDIAAGDQAPVAGFWFWPQNVAGPLNEHTINFSVRPATGGMVTARNINGINVPISSGDTIADRTAVEFEATANSGYIFSHWEVDFNGGPQISPLPTQRITEIYIEHREAQILNATAIFIVDDRPVPEGNAVIFPATVDAFVIGQGRITSGDRVPDGTWVVFNATLLPGRRVENWSFAGSQPAAVPGMLMFSSVVSVQINQDTTVTLIDAPIAVPPPDPIRTVTISGSNAGTGATGAGTYRQGSIATVHAGPPAAGMRFNGWTSIPLNIITAGINDPTTTFTVPAGNVALTAHWVADTAPPPPPPPPPPPVYTVTVTGSQLAAGTGANQSGAGSYNAGAVVTVRAGVRAGHTFSGWTATPAVSFSDANNPVATFPMPASNVAVTANWTEDAAVDAQRTVTFSAIPAAGGSVTATTATGSISSGAQVPNNTAVTFTAAPSAGFLISEWRVNGAVVNVTGNQHTVTVTQNTTVQVTFGVPDTGVVLARMVGGQPERLGASFDFPNRRPGYSAMSPLEVAILNQYATATGALTVQLTGPDASSFILRGGAGGSGTSDSLRNISSIPAHSNRANAFSVVPRTGLSSRSTPYTAVVTVSSATGGGISVSFQVRFEVNNDTALTGDFFSLNLRAETGGSVSIDGSSFSSNVTRDFRDGDRVRIEARPARDYVFDGWSYSWGETFNEWREDTTFIMPNRNVTVWARFVHHSQWSGQGGGWTDGPGVSQDTAGFPGHAPPPLANVAPPAVVPPLAQVPSIGVGVPGQPAVPVTPEPAPVAAALVTTPLSVNINGTPLNFSGQSAVMANGVALIPVRGFFEALGYSVSWDNATSTATMTRQNIVIVITEGERSFTVSGTGRTLRAPATMINGHLMVPFVEIIESIGGRAHRDVNDVVNVFITR